MERLGAVVLAAGRSTRMGEFKPLLEVEGSSLLAWAVGAFKIAGVDDVVVVAGHRRDEVAAEAAAAGARVLTNADYDAGMYSSLRVGVLGLDAAAGRFFVLPADMPLVRPETIGRLVRQGRAARTTAGSRVRDRDPAEHGASPVILLAASLRRDLRSADPPGGLRELLDARAAATTRVSVDDLGVLLDADTPDDLARLRERAPREALPDVRALSGAPGRPAGAARAHRAFPGGGRRSPPRSPPP